VGERTRPEAMGKWTFHPLAWVVSTFHAESNSALKLVYDMENRFSVYVSIHRNLGMFEVI